MKQINRCLEKKNSWIDFLVDTIRNPYSEEEVCGDIVPAKSATHATKKDIVWAIIKLASCIAVFVLGICCMDAVAVEPFWRLAVLIASMLVSFVIHCFAAHKLEELYNTKI